MIPIGGNRRARQRRGLAGSYVTRSATFEDASLTITITSSSGTVGIFEGSTVSGAGIQDGTVVESITDLEITLSLATDDDGENVPITFGAP